MKTRYYISQNKAIFGCGWSNFENSFTENMQEVNWLEYWIYRLSHGRIIQFWTFLSKGERK